MADLKIIQTYSEIALSITDGTQQVIATGGANGSWVTDLRIASNESSNHNLAFYRSTYLIETIAVVGNAGKDGIIPSINALSKIATVFDENGNFIFELPPSATLQVKALSIPSAGIYITGTVGNF